MTKNQEILALRSDKPIKPSLLKELARHLQQHDIEVLFFDVDAYYLQKCKQLILEKGPSYVLSLERLQEAFLPKAETRDTRDLLIRVLSNQLQALAPSKDLIIVDGYFFSTGSWDKADYLDTFREIFGPVIPKIEDVRFITKSQYDRTLYQSIEQVLAGLNPYINISHKTTDDFHDRFWIVDKTKGLFVGTSLNGIGRRYALTDYMRDDDIVAIVKELQRLSLLN
jgi:hypothetical protein